MLIDIFIIFRTQSRKEVETTSFLKLETVIPVVYKEQALMYSNHFWIHNAHTNGDIITVEWLLHLGGGRSLCHTVIFKLFVF